jgi:hypothetical protein
MDFQKLEEKKEKLVEAKSFFKIFFGIFFVFSQYGCGVTKFYHYVLGTYLQTLS